MDLHSDWLGQIILALETELLGHPRSEAQRTFVTGTLDSVRIRRKCGKRREWWHILFILGFFYLLRFGLCLIVLLYLLSLCFVILLVVFLIVLLVVLLVFLGFLLTFVVLCLGFLLVLLFVGFLFVGSIGKREHPGLKEAGRPQELAKVSEI